MESESGQVDDLDGLPRQAGFSMEPHQRQLMRVLNEKDERLADMYVGALRVATDAANPDSLPQAAHSYRELMDHMPRHMEVPVNRPLMSSRLAEVRQAVDRVPEPINSGNPEHVAKAVKAIRSIKKVVRKVTQEYPRQRDKVQQFLNTLDPMHGLLPGTIGQLRVDEWEVIRNYFVDVCHHGKPSNIAEFRKMQFALERFLLDRLKPRTFDDQRAILEIIKEGESDAQP